MIGDGLSEVYHCEFATEELWYNHEPDSNPVHCNVRENDDNS